MDINRDSKGKFVVGNTISRKKKKMKDINLYTLMKKIKHDEDINKRDFLQHIINQCYKDNQFLVAVLKKILPDKIEHINDKATKEQLQELSEKLNSMPVERLYESLGNRLNRVYN